VQTCSKCNAQVADHVASCPACGADLRVYSTSSVAIRRYRANPRVKNVRLVARDKACPSCKSYTGTYEKEQAPTLPLEGCSCPHGCTCFYEPMLDEIYP
jgi:RNA polymerase subunit RPABC4/transcription elongation factor Spt4